MPASRGSNSPRKRRSRDGAVTQDVRSQPVYTQLLPPGSVQADYPYKIEPYTTTVVPKENELRVGGIFRLSRRLGSGSFGEIFLGLDVESNKEVAVKLETANCKHPQLMIEAKVYRLLKDGWETQIPKVLYCGTEGDYNIMVMELLGPSLEDLHCFCSRQFTLKTVLMLAEQMIDRMKFVHSHDYIHRDIKPDNFLVGLRRPNKIYLIDFGLSKKYRDPRQSHIQCKEGKKLTGTARYCSLNVHRGFEPSRRDDMESLGYCFIYFLKSSLPWQGLTASNKAQKYEKISERKFGTSLAELCSGIPKQFETYMRLCRDMIYTESPDYEALKWVFRELFLEKQYSDDLAYDWYYYRLRQPNSNGVR